MAAISGNGGTVTNMTPVTPVVLNITKGTVNLGYKLVENSHSGTNGASNYEGVIEDNSWDIEGGVESTNLPDTDVGISGGQKVNMKFKLGGSSKFTLLTGTTVEKITYIDDNQSDIVRFTASGKGGKKTLPVTG